jgi:hypothetical protein
MDRPNPSVPLDPYANELPGGSPPFKRQNALMLPAGPAGPADPATPLLIQPPPADPPA